MKRPPRKHISLAVKLAACLDALGFDVAAREEIEWEHTIPLALRAFDPETGKYDPDEHDPRYLRPMLKGPHKIKTFGTPATTAGSDIGNIAKVKRLSRKEAEFRQRLLAAEPHPESKKRKWPTRKMRGRAKSACGAQKKRV